MSDKVEPRDNSKTGIMPRVELEPALHHEAPPPSTPEIFEDESSKTGEMPALIDLGDDLDTSDEDSPDGK